jgi:hypothetical protein
VPSRLAQVRPGLADTIARSAPEKRRRAAREAAWLAFRESGLSDPLVEAALWGETRDRGRLEALVTRLDEEAWDLQRAAEGSAASEREYEAAFRRARAANAALYLVDDAAEDVLYEAFAAVSDERDLEEAVMRLV